MNVIMCYKYIVNCPRNIIEAVYIYLHEQLSVTTELKVFLIRGCMRLGVNGKSRYPKQSDTPSTEYYLKYNCFSCCYRGYSFRYVAVKSITYQYMYIHIYYRACI